MRRTRVLGALLPLLLALGPAGLGALGALGPWPPPDRTDGTAQVETPAGEDPVERRATARLQLDHARGLKLAMRGTEGIVRERARDAAVSAYRAVRRYHPQAHAVCAEAAFRAGELLRAGGRADAALAEFQEAQARGAGTAFRARAWLEIGHLHRRAKRSDAALDAYLAVAVDEGACACRRDESLLWAGRVWAADGRDADARRVLLRVAEAGEDPVDRVRAYDELALLHLDRGDPEAAAGMLNACRLALSEVALERTRTGEKVRDAMQRMRVVDALHGVAKARERARRAQVPEKK